MQDKHNEIILYQPDNSVRLDVLVDSETVWLNRQQMAVLFDRDVKTIGKHINNALKEELAEVSVVADFATTDKIPTVAKFATVQLEGNREVLRTVEHYNLDVILSVGYRVKSNRGIQFRIWANKVLKEYILKGYAIHDRFERLENRVSKTEKQIDFFVKTSLPPKEGVFFEGQIFDAYAFASDLVKSAKKSIVLIDNYIDETVLLLLSKRSKKVSAEIHTKHNAQYAPINICETKSFHDRFLIIDDTVYHIGASLKDLGRKLFAFSRMGLKRSDILK